jgi:hypothetical protein
MNGGGFRIIYVHHQIKDKCGFGFSTRKKNILSADDIGCRIIFDLMLKLLPEIFI